MCPLYLRDEREQRRKKIKRRDPSVIHRVYSVYKYEWKVGWLDRGQYGNSIFVTVVRDDHVDWSRGPRRKAAISANGEKYRATGAVQFETRTFQFYEEYVEMFLSSWSE